MKVDESYQADLTLPLDLVKPGTYPLVLIMHYTDANQYPFSALTCQTFVNEKEVISPVFGQGKSVSFNKEGKLGFSIKNMSDEPVTVKTSLIAPRELTVEQNERELQLAPRSDQESDFSLKNFSALGGSTYQLFALAQSEDADYHYTSIFPGTVKITANQGVFGFSYTMMGALLALLLVVFIISQLLAIRKK